MRATCHSFRPIIALGGALLGLLALLLALQGGAIAQGTGTDPAFRAITVTADLPISDTHPYEGVTKTVYFNNSGAGTITLTVELTGTPPLTLTAGAAFAEGEREYTSTETPAIFVVTYPVETSHGDQPGIPYTATNGDGLMATLAITYVRDITAPTATIVTPAGDLWISTTLQVTGTAEDGENGSGVARVEVTTGTAWVLADGTTSWSTTWPPPAGQNGVAYTFSVSATDFVGNAQAVAATRVITVDNVMTGTVGNLTSTTHLIGVWSNQATVTVTWSPADDGPGIGLGGYSALWDTSPDTSAPPAVNLGASATTTSTQLADGDSHYFHVRAADALGNWADTTVHLGPFKIDTVSPSVTITLPASGAVLTTTHLPQTPIGGQSSDDRSGVAWVDVTTGTAWVSATGTTDWSYAWALPTVDRQVYTLTARARDGAGNWGTSGNVTVTVDTVAPGANAPHPHKSPWVTSTVVYTWAASTDGSGIAGYWVNITNTAGYTAVLWANGPALTFTGALTEGAGYFARVQAVDGAGNTGGWSGLSAVVTPDLTAPAVVVTAPTQVATGTFVVSWSASDSGSGVDFYSVSYREDGGLWQTWIPVTTTTQATFVSGTLEHTYVFSVTAVDRAGNPGVGTATTKVARWRVYIPLVLRNYRPFVNGSFENGLAGWTVAQSPLPASIVPNVAERTGDTTPPADGQQVLLLGNPDYSCNGMPLGYVAVEQTFVVPHDAISLTFKYIIWTQDASPQNRYDYDLFEVWLSNERKFDDANRITTGLNCNTWRRVPGSENPRGGVTSGWAQGSINLQPYRGQTVTVSFRLYSRYDNWYNTYVYIDDVKIIP